MKLLLKSLLMSALLMAAAQVSAADIDINWQAPTQNVDGSPLTDLAGFEVYLGPAEGQYEKVVVLNDPAQTQAVVPVTVDWLQPGDNTIFVVMTAFDAEGNVSAYSNVVTEVVTVTDNVPPGAPVIITVAITVGDPDCPPGYTCFPVVIAN